MSLITIISQLLLIGLGVFYLIRSLFPIHTLIQELSMGTLRKKWTLLSLLIYIFIISYCGFAYNLWLIREEANHLSFAITMMLLFGGMFAYLVGDLALQTMTDIKSLAVLKHENITDGLMGIKNRRYFDQRLSEEVALAKRYKLPLSVILIDIDYFKKINDTYGHKIGDEVLINLAQLMESVARDTDIVARYGGEEIVILTPNSSKSEAANLAERLRIAIEKTTVATIESTQEIIQVTASFGVCALSPIITDQEALMEEADQALYLAKKYGRNRVVSSNW
ncbi:MAG: GGDEF domain-containing protein [Sulfurospirillaceae bacterium]|nr:GGDEF domain-containing protein [Sulfurospirillaceae bacterium]